MLKRVTVTMSLEAGGVPSMIDLIEDALMSNESIIKIDEVEEDDLPFDDKHNYRVLHP
jgi:DUF917 family protein